MNKDETIKFSLRNASTSFELKRKRKAGGLINKFVGEVGS
jgi:hypothetical protein